MFEHRRQPLIPAARFYLRFLRHLLVGLGIVFCGLGIGVLGYHHLEHLPWIDALLNASMILGGMGPVDQLHTVPGKLFASFYAIFSGTLFLVVIGLVMAPLVHRFLHRFHLEITEDDTEPSAPGATQ